MSQTTNSTLGQESIENSTESHVASINVKWLQQQVETGIIYFNIEFYARQFPDIGRDTEDLVKHYLDFGEAAGAPPSDQFDPKFYKAAYADVRDAGVSPLVHYLQNGFDERRYPNRAALASDAELIKASGLFLESFYRAGDLNLDGLRINDAEHYLLFGGYRGVSPGPVFNSGFYRSVYHDVAALREDPLVHYLRIGRTERRYMNNADLEFDMARVRQSLDHGFYRAQLSADVEPDDLTQHFLLHGDRAGLDPAPGFSTAYYVARYQDVDDDRFHPFGHFAAHGLSEGRKGRPDLTQMLSPGGLGYDPDRPTILIANHESSRTGAPLVGLAIAHSLCGSHNIISHSGRLGELDDEMWSVSSIVVDSATDELDLSFALAELKRGYALEGLIANSVETHTIIRAASEVDLPTVLLLHEFSEYALPPGKVGEAVAAADRVLVPAQLVLASTQAQIETFYGAPASNISICPQGYLPPGPKRDRDRDLSRDDILEAINAGGAVKPKIVLGAGAVQIRKGVDLFVQTAAEVRRLYGEDVRFVWIGSGYKPVEDLNFGLWISESVKRMGLEDHVFFFPEQKGLDRFFEVADVFYLPSRLDPFPNVAIDALNEGLPVVCFREGTGVAEFIDQHGLVGSAAPYQDVTAAAGALTDFLKLGRAIGLPNKQFAETEMDFGRYVARVLSELDQARRLRTSLVDVRARLEQSGVFDAAFHNGTRRPHKRRALTQYISRGRNGLAAYNPLPGFHDGLFRDQNNVPKGASLVPLDAALASNSQTTAPKTHICHRLKSERPEFPRPERAALHLHMHYVGKAEFFCARLQSFNLPIDLFVTTTDAAKLPGLDATFKNYTRGRVRISAGPNRGRDIGPLLTELAGPLREGNYSLIGHLHAKESKDIASGVGDRWRDYLLNHLFGTPGEAAHIFNLFNRNPKLGLLFPEDRHCVGWTKNKPKADALRRRLGLEQDLPDHPIFPLGNMFWARAAVLEPLFDLGLQWSDYPPEPLPYDGTILHAIERILPTVCISQGHEWQTVYKPGEHW